MSIRTGASTLADAIWTNDDGSRALLRNATLAIVGSLFVAACAQAEVPMWPVPMTMQTFAVLVVGMAFGWKLGGATLLLYAAEGAMGLPVFSGFKGGPGVLVGPTAGYIFGFVLAAVIVGWLAEQGWDRDIWRSVAAMTLGTAAILIPGVVWLAGFFASGGASITGTGATSAFGAAIAAGLTPFLFGAVLKIALATAVVRLGWKLPRANA